MLSPDGKLGGLSDRDLKLLRRVLVRARIWRWSRWLTIGVGLCMLALGAYYWVALWRELEQEQLLLMLIAVVAPACSFLVLLGLIFVGYSLIRWKGDRRIDLLLRLTEDRIR